MCGKVVEELPLTIIVGFLEVHVDNATRPHLVHGGAVNRANLLEGTSALSVAAILGEEDRDVVVRELGDTVRVAGLLVGGITTPRVDIVAPEVDRGGRIATVEVVGQIDSGLGIVIVGIADANGAVVLRLDVGFHVSHSGLDESSRLGVGGIVCHFVTGKETKRVGVFCHGVNHRGVSAVQLGVP